MEVRMMKKRVAGYGLFLFMFLVLTACGGGGKSGDPGTGFSPSPGLGGGNGDPTGEPFRLPDGITSGTIVGASHPRDAANQPILTQPECRNTTEPVETVNLAAGFVDLCVELVNSTGRDVPLTLPGGLIFVSLNAGVQNGVLAQRVDFTVPAGGKWVLVRLYCLNKHFPGADGERYRIGPITDYAPLKEAVGILQGKQIDQQETAQVQGAIWQVTDDPAGLTDAVRDILKGL
jgi:hypothetical protein